jgi:hypothetical protein
MPALPPLLACLLCVACAAPPPPANDVVNGDVAPCTALEGTYATRGTDPETGEAAYLSWMVPGSNPQLAKIVRIEQGGTFGAPPKVFELSEYVRLSWRGSDVVLEFLDKNRHALAEVIPREGGWSCQGGRASRPLSFRTGGEGSWPRYEELVETLSKASGAGLQWSLLPKAGSVAKNAPGHHHVYLFPRVQVTTRGGSRPQEDSYLSCTRRSRT